MERRIKEIVKAMAAAGEALALLNGAERVKKITRVSGILRTKDAVFFEGYDEDSKKLFSQKIWITDIDTMYKGAVIDDFMTEVSFRICRRLDEEEEETIEAAIDRYAYTIP